MFFSSHWKSLVLIGVIVAVLYKALDENGGDNSVSYAEIAQKMVTITSMNVDDDQGLAAKNTRELTPNNLEVVVAKNTLNVSTNHLELSNDENEIMPTDGEHFSRLQDEHLRNLELAQNLANEGEWEKFDFLSDDLAAIDENSLTHLLMLSILKNAPFELIVGLLNKGAKFNFPIFKAIIYNNNVQLMDKLTSHGLNIHMVDTKGYNGIFYSLDLIPNQEMFRYLIQNGVSVNLHVQEMDNLEKALRKCIESESSAVFVETLLNHGAKVGKRHFSVLELLREKNSECGSSYN